MSRTGRTGPVLEDGPGLDQELAAIVEHHFRWGRHGTGYQLAVTTGSEPPRAAFGGDGHPGTPMRATTRHNVWCAAKPVTASIAVAAAEVHGIALDGPLGELIPALATTRPEITLRQVLEHSAGLSRSGLAKARLHGVEQIDALVAEDLEHEPYDDGYSELSGWWVLGQLLEALSGRPAVDVVDDALRASGLGGIRYGYRSGARPHRSELGVYYEWLVPRWVPMPHDASPAFLSEWHVTYGASTSMLDLARWYRRVLERIASDDGPDGLLPSGPLLRSVLAAPHETRWNVAMDAEVGFAGGFMVGLDRFLETPSVGQSAIGHVGWLGASLAWADPERDLTIALLVNGTPRPGADLAAERSDLTDALVRCFTP